MQEPTGKSEVSISYVTLEEVSTTSIASLIGTSGFALVSVRHVDARGLKAFGLDDYVSTEFNDQCWVTKSDVCGGLEGDERKGCEEKECAPHKCQLGVAT